MSERPQDETPRHLRRYSEPDIGPKGRFDGDDKKGLWAIAAHITFFLVAAALVLGR
ncbi:hypothetical protein V5F49_12280 [Xanthobacter sp. V3C-3]|uniref:hypothetical protein n=1 Tax=Xanthobacter lutulentifluminis TaxID=3119935 RepID=UPI00372B19AA